MVLAHIRARVTPVPKLMTTRAQALALSVIQFLTLCQLSAYTASAENDKDSDYDVSENGVSLTYTIADGLSASVTHTDMDVRDNDDTSSTSGNYTVVAVNLSF